MEKIKKIRLDVLLCEKGFFESRERAKATIMSGVVFVNGQKSDKPGMNVPQDADIEVRGNTLPYVSRGGLKLEKAIKEFGLTLSGLICMDIGASTGGFTDCMLQNGAVKVYAIDVGYGQLAWKLRTDERVVNMERTNIRFVTSEQLGINPDFCSIDVSFISLKLVLPVVKQLLRSSGRAVCLIKPQFEAGKERVGKKGVVRDSRVHIDVINDFLNYAREFGFGVMGLSYSPIKGPEGNIEYLALLENGACDNNDFDVETLVKASHGDLDK